MARAGWWLFKWVGIPLLLLGVGFFVIGPMIGKSNQKNVNLASTSPASSASDQASSDQTAAGQPDNSQPDQANNSDTTGQQDTISGNHTAPKVAVTVRRSSSFRPSGYYDGISSRRHYRRRRRRRSETAPAAPAAPADTAAPAADGFG